MEIYKSMHITNVLGIKLQNNFLYLMDKEGKVYLLSKNMILTVRLM